MEYMDHYNEIDLGSVDAPPSREFLEIRKESRERRRARLNHRVSTCERMIQALNKKNKRDFEAQQ